MADPFMDEFNRARASQSRSSGKDPFMKEFKAAQAERAKRTAGEAVGQSELGDIRMAPSMRFAISFGEKLKEKQAIFEKRHPQGKLKRLPGTGTIVFQEDPSKPFSPVDPKEFSVREGFADLLELLGEDAGPIAGETALLVGTGGASLLLTAGRAMLGAVLGEFAEEGGEIALGISDETLGETGRRAVASGTLAPIGVGIGRGVEKLVNIPRGGGLLRLSDTGRAQVQAFERLGLGLPTPGQVSDSPIVRRLEGQSGAVGRALTDFFQGQQAAVEGAFRRIQDPKAANRILDTMQKTEERLRNKALGALRMAKKDFAETADNIKKAVAEWDTASRQYVDALYARARSIEEPIFDPNEVERIQTLAAVELFGVRSYAKPTARPTQTVVKQLPRGRIRQTKPAGPAPEQTVPLSEPGPSLKDILRKLRDIDPQLRTVTTTIDGQRVEIPVVEQLRTIRQELFDLKTAPTVGAEGVPITRRAEQAAAGRLFKAVDDLLFNPANGSPAYMKAWRGAGQAARERFAAAEKAILIEAAKTDTPVKLLARITGPNSFDELRTLRSILSPKRFEDLQGAFKTRLLETSNVTSRLDSFDKETLSMLLSPGELKAFRQYGKSLDKIKKLDLAGIAEETGRANLAVERLVRTATPGQTDLFTQSLKEMAPEDRLTFRAATLDYLFRQGVVKGPKGETVVSGDMIEAAYERLERAGLDTLLKRSKRETIKDIELAARTLALSRRDAGTSILAAGVTRAAVREPLQGNILDPLFEIAQLMGIGRFLTYGWAQRLLIGSSKKIEPSAFAAIAGAGLIQMTSDLDRLESELKERPEPAAADTP